MNKDIDKANKQFYKFWKKESKDWCRTKLHTFHKYIILCSFSQKIEIPLYKIINQFLYENVSTISGSPKEEVEEKIGEELTVNEFCAFMCFAGYEFKEGNRTYVAINERVKRIQNVCDATKECLEDGFPKNTREIDERRLKYYTKKCEKYEIKKDKYGFKLYTNTGLVEPANGERANSFNGILNRIILIIGLGLLCGIFLISIIFIIFSNNKGLDISSMWNVLLGACIPGIVTVSTTFWLIDHEYKVDYHRERMGVMPVFSMTSVGNKNLLVNQDGRWDVENLGFGKFFNDSEINNLKNDSIEIFKLTNKGCGMAFDIHHDKGGEIIDFGDIAQGEDYYLALRKIGEDRELVYVLAFMDIYGNKYTQRFRIIKDQEISSFPPELVLRTKWVRYQQ